MMLLLTSKFTPNEGKGKYYLIEGRGPISQNTTENLKDAIASFPNGKARKWGRGEPYKGKRRRKGKNYKDSGLLDEIMNRKGYPECSLTEHVESKEHKVPGCGGFSVLICTGGCLSIRQVLLLAVQAPLVLLVLVMLLCSKRTIFKIL